MEKTIEKLGIDAQVLIDTLQKMEIGQKIEYSTLREAIGAKTDNALRGALFTARNRLMRDSRMVFGVIRGEGLVRLSDSEKIGKAYSSVNHIRRSAHRGLTILQSIDSDSLAKADLTKMNVAVSHLGILVHATTSNAGKKLSERVIANNGLVPPMVGMEILK